MTRDRRPLRGRTPDPGPVRWALHRHLAGTVAVLVGVIAVAVVWAERLAATESLEHAETDARLLAAEYVAPLVADDLHSDDSAARRAMADALDARIRAGTVREVKIWAPVAGSTGTDAEVVFSARAGLEGRVLDLGDQHGLFGTTDAMANTVSTADYGDAALDGTIEVYLGFVDRQGSPFVFEAYLPTPRTASSRAELLREWLPVVLGSLVLLTVTTLPLSALLARRVASAELDRRRAVGAALDAVLDERRRLSRRLRDGVVQDLAAVALALDGLAARSGDDPTRAVLDRTGRLVRADLLELRAVGEGLFADHLGSAGLVEAVEELIRATDSAADDVRLRVDPDVVGLPEETSILAYRIVREGLRNAAAHSGATTVTIELALRHGHLEVTVTDDGRGLDAGAETSGHWGLRLLRVAARDAGGTLEISSAPGQGTRLAARLPAVAQPPAT